MSYPVADYLDLEHTAHAVLFPQDQPVWSALARIADYLRSIDGRDSGAKVASTAWIGDQVILEEGVIVEPNAVIKGPAWIGKGTQVRAGCYIRENVIVGEGCVLGNSCEFKNCVLFDNCEVPHFNYVGDSILGYKAHLGAGVTLSNVRLDRGMVSVRGDDLTTIDTGLRKFGAIIGDRAEIGCQSVINPGSIIGRRSVIYPLANFTGVLPADSLLKVRQAQQMVAKMVR
jgi:UDP-N-acetylglucosamine diphosphorylase / glucose-1-phosphate thymidylyltransferase / UDP-N-acetylgalactosamine diphosphorylase / glucosamine-1-phosphate N-acetyltransferase / galactosamine-1-phosphate N-acetyltransferase